MSGEYTKSEIYNTVPKLVSEVTKGNVLISRSSHAPFEVLDVIKAEGKTTIRVKGLEGTDGSERNWEYTSPHDEVDLKVEK